MSLGDAYSIKQNPLNNPTCQANPTNCMYIK